MIGDSELERIYELMTDMSGGAEASKETDEFNLNKLITPPISIPIDENNNTISTETIEYTHLSKKHQQLKKYKRQNLEKEVVKLQVLEQQQVKEVPPKVTKKFKNLPEAATTIMKQWFEEHSGHPYPTEVERTEMARKGELAENQVKAWFANKRNRSNQKKGSNLNASRRNKKPISFDVSQQIETTLDTIVSSNQLQLPPQPKIKIEPQTPKAILKKQLLIQPRPSPLKLANQQHKNQRNLSFDNLHSQQQQQYLKIPNNFANFQANRSNLVKTSPHIQADVASSSSTSAQQALLHKLNQQKQHFHMQMQQFQLVQQIQQQQMVQQQQNNQKLSWDQHYFNPTCCNNQPPQQAQFRNNFTTDLNNYFNPIVTSPQPDQMQLPFGNIPTPKSAHSASSLTSTFNFNEPTLPNNQQQQQQFHKHYQQIIDNNCCNYASAGAYFHNQIPNLNELANDPMNSGMMFPGGMSIPVNMNNANQYECDTPPPIIQTKQNKEMEPNNNEGNQKSNLVQVEKASYNQLNNSAFQQYSTTAAKSELIDEADRFTDDKNHEWCVSHHPRLSNTLLSKVGDQ